MVGHLPFPFGVQELSTAKSVTGEYEHSSSKYRSPSERHDEKKAFFMDQ
jgi:hypothetical protein